jgi:hypothetical protein
MHIHHPSRGMGMYNAFGSWFIFKGKTINTTVVDVLGMQRRHFSLPRPALSREKNLVLILLAVLTAVILWNTFWWMMRIVLFVVVVYTIYQILKHYV